MPTNDEEQVVEGEEEDEVDPEAGPTAQAEPPQDPPAPTQPANHLKVVIILKDDNVLLGVQSPNCDPVYTTMKGDLPAALKRAKSLVAEAKQKWATAPLNPKANLPEPPPAPTLARTSAATKSAKPKEQQSMF